MSKSTFSLTVAVTVLLAESIFATSINIDGDTATTPILEDSTILVDGWVIDAQEVTLPPPGQEGPPQTRALANKNKVKLYFYYQEQPPDEETGYPGSTLVQCDAGRGTMEGQTADLNFAYTGEVGANGPGDVPTAGSMFFLEADACLNDVVVASATKDVIFLPKQTTPP